MNDNTFYVITFNSTHHAIKGEKILLNKGLDIRTIPTPREITASCGLSIKFSSELLKEVKSIVEENKLDIKGIFEIKKNLTEKKVRKF